MLFRAVDMRSGACARKKIACHLRFIGSCRCALRDGTLVARKVELKRDHTFEEDPALPVLFKLIRTTQKNFEEIFLS